MKAILYDVKRCKGCMKCVEACCVSNELSEEGSRACFTREGLSDQRFTTLTLTEDERFVRQQCMHCIEPSCEAACIVGAIRKTPEGPVVYDADKCIGCRYCMLACPFEVPRYEWKSNHPFIAKCQMCVDREGGPACVEACPHFAAEYGDRDALLAKAKRRIGKHPDQYRPKVWGELDAGGTCVLYVSDVDLDEFWPGNIGETSIPEMTWPVVEKTPFLFAGVAGTVSALSWVIHRRNRLAAEKAEGDENDAA
ncbi:MAG: 4Fe-4S dicluster domain-containing protein [Planctomycetota bacterium]